VLTGIIGYVRYNKTQLTKRHPEMLGAEKRVCIVCVRWFFHYGTAVRELAMW